MADLRAMLERIEAGELDATAAMRHRIEGAMAVLELFRVGLHASRPRAE